MYNRLYNFLADHNIISNKQYGFRENYSTYMAIIDLVDKILLLQLYATLSYAVVLCLL